MEVNGLGEFAADAVGDEVASSFSRLLQRAGGIQLARSADHDPDVRATLIPKILAQFGSQDADIRTEAGLAALVSVAREAGRVVLPYPVAEVLSVAGTGRPPLWVVDRRSPVALGSDVVGDPEFCDIHGKRVVIENRVALRGRLAVDAVSGTLAGVAGERTQHDVARVLLLQAAYALGGLEAVHDLAVRHAGDRHQFGRSLSAFQGVQMMIADMRVALAGVAELLAYTRWSLLTSPPETAYVDVLALRLACAEAAETVLNYATQVHGAIAFTEEHDMTVFIRHLHLRLRLPLDTHAVARELAAAIERYGFSGPFGHLIAPEGLAVVEH